MAAEVVMRPYTTNVADVKEFLYHRSNEDKCEASENGVTKVYETMDFFMFQSLFDKLSSDFIPPLFNLLTKLEIENINGTLPLPNDVSVEFELEHLKIANASISPDTPILTINTQDGVLFAFDDLTLNFTTDYSYIMDPPVFADIGEASILIAPTNVSTNVNTRLYPTTEGNSLEVDLTNMHVESQSDPFTSFVGVSDFSEVASNTINTIAAALKNRLESFINGGDLYGLDSRIEAVINKIVNLVPGQIYFGNGLYIDGWLYTNF